MTEERNTHIMAEERTATRKATPTRKRNMPEHNYVCPTCSKSFAHQKNRKRNFENHRYGYLQKDEVTALVLCLESTQAIAHYVICPCFLHTRWDRHGNSLIPCPYCSKLLKNVGTMTIHLAVHHQVERWGYERFRVDDALTADEFDSLADALRRVGTVEPEGPRHKKVRARTEQKHQLFNHTADPSDKRYQVPDIASKPTMEPYSVLFKKLSAALRQKRFVQQGHKLNLWTLLGALPGCDRQHIHTDFNGMVYITTPTTGHPYPLSIIIAVENDTKLWLHPGSKFGEELDYDTGIMLHLRRGDGVVFAGRTVHAGAEYDKLNVRLHMYVSTPDCSVPDNETILVQCNPDNGCSSCVGPTNEQ
jgi:uncharacterized C2H2 Zn-finger protein